MIELNEAVKLDIEQSLVEASEAYEEVIQHDDAILEGFINLACLYWQVTDYGFNATHKLPVEFVQKAGDRMYQILDVAEKRFGSVAEIEFWRNYFNFTTLGGDSFLDKAIGLGKSGSSLVPYFHIYTQTKDDKYLPEVNQLFTIARTQLTTKNRYIISILES